MTTNYTFTTIFEGIYLPSRPELALRTTRQLRYDVNRWDRLTNNMPATAVTAETLAEFRDKCVFEKLSPTTVNRNIETIIKLMRAAGFQISVDWQKIKLAWYSPKQKLTLDDLARVWSVAEQAKWPPVDTKDYRALRTDCVPGFWMRALIMLCYTTGLRRAELFALRWDRLQHSSIEVTFDKGIRPKRFPITAALRPWLKLLAENKTPTVLGRCDEFGFDQEQQRLRLLSGVNHFCLSNIRELSVEQWERAGTRCGPLILRRKIGDRVSEKNYAQLLRASTSLFYPDEFVTTTNELRGPRMFTDVELALPAVVQRQSDKTDRSAAANQADECASSFSAFNTFFSFDDNGREGIVTLTLRQVFEKSLRGILETDEVEASTIDKYQVALSHWEFLTDNPQVGKITTELLQQFRKACKEDGRNNSPATWNSYFRCLRSIFNHLGPRSNRSKRSRAALKVFEEIPWLDDLKAADPDPIHLDESSINLIYRHANVATWPPKSRTGCDPTDWWRAGLVMLVNYGPRRDDWLYLPSKAISFERGELTFVAHKTGKTHSLVLNPTVEWHLQRVMMTGREFVFSPTQAHCQLYREWHRIQTAAGVANPDGAPFGFHDVRATAAARYHDHAPGTAELLLGHALRRDVKVTAQSYLGKKYLTPLHRAIRTIPQPAAFIEGMKTPPTPTVESQTQSVDSGTDGKVRAA